ncbi:MAG: hypothetical protein V4469_04635 [Patescibacteria group bacterium]
MEPNTEDLLNRLPTVSNEVIPRLIISAEAGFIPLHTESISSKVFIKDGKVFKLNNRNSVERAESDAQVLKTRLAEYEDHLPDSTIVECEYEGVIYTCVVQEVIEGEELKKLGAEQLREALKENKDFLLELLKYFFESIEAKKLYPDIVGYPKDPEYFNSVNLILEKESNKVILCDVGLSPHQDTLDKNGLDFYDSENVRIYVAKMRKFQELLLEL